MPPSRSTLRPKAGHQADGGRRRALRASSPCFCARFLAEFGHNCARNRQPPRGATARGARLIQHRRLDGLRSGQGFPSPTEAADHKPSDAGREEQPRDRDLADDGTVSAGCPARHRTRRANRHYPTARKQALHPSSSRMDGNCGRDLIGGGGRLISPDAPVSPADGHRSADGAEDGPRTPRGGTRG